MRVIITILFLSFGFVSLSQGIQIKGLVFDSVNNRFISNASVVLLNKNDSIILNDARTLSNGSFTFSNLRMNQSFLLFVSYPGYVSLTKEIPINNALNAVIDLGKVYVTSQVVLLQEVVVKSNIRSIQLRGDTLQYATSAIKLPPNASVEDLLKVLPGLQVDPSGKITAQGKKVKKVLVDGEEFFSDDPVFVTRNLRSEMIANVQVYDKKSDAAVFTGIDDGVKDKVINLQLKQDKSIGVFGKVEAGIGRGVQYSPYNGQVMLNAFKKKRKLSTYFSSNNVGQFGLGSTDKNQLGLGNEMEQYDGKGLPEFSTTGVHYDNKWGKDLYSFNGDYYYSISNVSGFDSNYTNTFLPTGTIRRFSNMDFQKNGFSHRANATYKQQVGKSANFTVSTIATYSKGASDQQYTASDVDDSQLFLNRTNAQISLSSDARRVKTSFSYQQKFKKAGRTFSASLEHLFSSDDEQQTNLSRTEFFNGKPLSDSIRNLNLLRSRDQLYQSTAIGLSFSEKVNKSLSVIFSVNVTFDGHDDHNLSKSFLNPLGNYDSSFSTERDDSRRVFTGNLSVNFNKGNIRTSFGGAAGSNRMTIQDIIQSRKLSKNFEVWRPFGKVQFAIGENSSLGLSYRGNSISPGFQELSPYAFNNSQLVTFSENLFIRNAFSNKVSFNYESFRSLSKAFTAIVLNFSSIRNPIKMQSVINVSGAYSLQYLNVSGLSDREIEMTGFYSRPIKLLKLQLTFDISGKTGENYSYINTALNRIRYNTSSIGVLLSKSKSGKYEAQVGGTLLYDFNRLTDGIKNTRNNFLSYKLRTSVDYYIADKVQIHTDSEFFRQGKNIIFANNFDRLIWNVWISKSFLSSNQLSIKVSANDLLNSNAGFARTASSTFFTENRYLNIQRYFMLTAAWNFTKYKQINP
ncbi:MAG: TonB-dependent receptor [Sediminibacterium sp.]